MARIGLEPYSIVRDVTRRRDFLVILDGPHVPMDKLVPALLRAPRLWDDLERRRSEDEEAGAYDYFEIGVR